MMIMETKYLQFVETFPHEGHKTTVIMVHSRGQGSCLGTISWYGPWRQYCFSPFPNCVFNNSCLKDVSDMLDRLMAEKKAGEIKPVGAG